jgi:hypothetical protein
MHYDYSILIRKITEKFGTQHKFADTMGLSERSTSKRLNDKVCWKSREICKAISLLNLSNEEVANCFFKEKVHVCEFSESEQMRHLEEGGRSRHAKDEKESIKE